MNKIKNVIKFYYGPMFSGKSLKLISDIEQAKNMYSDEEILVFKPLLDTRVKNEIFSRAGKNYPAISILNSKDIDKYINNKIKHVFIDEVQFFDKEIINKIKWLKNNNINVTISGLDTNFKRDLFFNSEQLQMISDENIKLASTCHSCGKEAFLSSRKIDGNFVDENSPEVLIEDLNKKIVEYFPLCENCHPTKKFLKEKQN